MNILHYTIGLPPIRRGGSVLYAYSLMKEQSKHNNVFALICGDTLFKGKKSKIRPYGVRNGIQVFRLVSPTTPTLVYGVKKPESIFSQKKIDISQITSFIKHNKIEIFHIHTFMGLPIEVLELIRQLGVKIIYTTHDYFGICLGYSMILPDFNICSNPDAKQCAVCNLNSPSEKFLRLANSDLYHFVKSHFNYKGKIKATATTQKGTRINAISQHTIAKYKQLQDYYLKMFSMIDVFHFNSVQTKEIFEKYIYVPKGIVANVTTSAISDRRKQKKIDPNNIQFGYLASTAEYKGFPILKNVLLRLYNDGKKNWTLNVWGGNISDDNDCPNIKYRGIYDYSDIEKIMCHFDGTIVPSKWHETFSLVTLESLSFGVPTIVSDHVGAKDIVKDIDPKLIFHSEEDLYLMLKLILEHPETLSTYNSKILEIPWKYTIERHAKEIYNIYKA